MADRRVKITFYEPDMFDEFEIGDNLEISYGISYIEGRVASKCLEGRRVEIMMDPGSKKRSEG